MKKLFVFTTYGAHKIRTMRQWECGSVCPCDPIRFFYFLLNPGACRGTYAARAHQPTGSEGRTLHAATSPFTGIRQCPKVHGADCGKTLYWRIGAAYLASEITSGLPVSHSWPTPGRMAAFESQKRAIPLKTARRGVTIKREAHIRRSSPHEAGGGTRQELTIKAKMPFVSSSADERKMDF